MTDDLSSKNLTTSRMMKLAIIAFVAIASSFLVNLMSMRQVVDGTNAQALANVYVILAFKGDFYFGVESRRRCYRLDIEKTDADGRFLFPPWRRSLNPFLSDARVEMTLYKPGYRALDESPMAGEPFKMVPDTRQWRSDPPFGRDPVPVAIMPPKVEPGVSGNGTSISPLLLRTPAQVQVAGRHDNLQAIVHELDGCGDVADKRKEAVLVSMYNEVRNMDKVSWGFVSNLLYYIEKIENGGGPDKFGGIRRGPADEHQKKRKDQMERRSSDIGNGALWDLPPRKGEK